MLIVLLVFSPMIVPLFLILVTWPFRRQPDDPLPRLRAESDEDWWTGLDAPVREWEKLWSDERLPALRPRLEVARTQWLPQMHEQPSDEREVQGSQAQMNRVTCPECHGERTVYDPNTRQQERCPTCKGAGTVAAE